MHGCLSGSSSLKKTDPSLISYQLPIAAQLKVGVHETPPNSWGDFACMVRSSVHLVYIVIAIVISSMQQPSHSQ